MKTITSFIVTLHLVAFSHPVMQNIQKDHPKATTSAKNQVQVITKVPTVRQSPKKASKGIDWRRKAIDGIKRFESFRAHPYKCPAGIHTIGYGFTGTYATHSKMSQATANKILEREFQKYVTIVKRNVKVPLTDNQLYALTSFTYNCGESSLKKLINGKGRLNAGNYKSVETLLPLYRKANGKILNGLVKRRSWEASLWKGTV